MQFHHDEQSKFFCMKADCVASLRAQGKKYDKAKHLITVTNRDDLVPLLNFMAQPAPVLEEDQEVCTHMGVPSSGATLEDKPTDNPIPDCVPEYLRKSWGY